MLHALVPVIKYLLDKQQYKDLVTLTSCNHYLSNNTPLNILNNNKNLNYIVQLFKKIRYENIDSIDIRIFTKNYNCNYIELNPTNSFAMEFIKIIMNQNLRNITFCFKDEDANGGLILEIDIYNDLIYSKNIGLYVNPEEYRLYKCVIKTNPKFVKLNFKNNIITIKMEKLLNSILNIQKHLKLN